MQSVGANLRAAIDAPVRTSTRQLLVWTAGDAAAPVDWTYMLQDWSVDRTPQDSPEGVSRFAGTIAAELTMTLASLSSTIPGGDGLTRSASISPYKAGLDLSAQGYGVGCKVQLKAGYANVDNELVTVFTGRIDSVGVGPDGAMSVKCVDFLTDLNAPATLAGAIAYFDDFRIPPFAVAEFLLRQAGYYGDAAPLVAPQYCTLAVPGIFPEVGQVYLNLQTLPDRSTYPVPQTVVPNSCIYTTAAPSLSSGFLVTQFRAALANAEIQFLGVFIITVTSTQVIVKDPFGGPIYWSATVASPVGAHIRVVLSYGTGIFTVAVNGTTVTPTSSSSLPPGTPYGWVSLAYTYDVQVHQVPSSGLVPTTNGWVRNYVANRVDRYAEDLNAPAYDGLDTTSNQMVPAQEGTVLSIIRDLALAVGAVFRFDESGVFEWVSREARRNILAGAPTATLDGNVLVSGGLSFDSTSTRKLVSCNINPVTQDKPADGASFAGEIARATDVITVPRTSTVTVDLPTKGLATALQPIGDNTANILGAPSCMTVVQADAVGDPAAQVLPGRVVASVAPIAGGVRVTLTNTRAVDLALWNPVNQQPWLIVKGITWSTSPSPYSMAASDRSREELVLEDSLWRQQPKPAREIVNTIAAEVAAPTMVFQDPQVRADPAMQVNDLVSVLVPDVMDAPALCQVVGLNLTEDVMTLKVRALYPPAGWVLGITGRTELDTNTILTA